MGTIYPTMPHGATRIEPKAVRVYVVSSHDYRTLPGKSLPEAFAGDVRDNTLYCNVSFAFSQGCMNDLPLAIWETTEDNNIEIIHYQNSQNLGLAYHESTTTKQKHPYLPGSTSAG